MQSARSCVASEEAQLRLRQYLERSLVKAARHRKMSLAFQRMFWGTTGWVTLGVLVAACVAWRLGFTGVMMLLVLAHCGWMYVGVVRMHIHASEAVRQAVAAGLRGVPCGPDEVIEEQYFDSWGVLCDSDGHPRHVVVAYEVPTGGNAAGSELVVKLLPPTDLWS